MKLPTVSDTLCIDGSAQFRVLRGICQSPASESDEGSLILCLAYNVSQTARLYPVGFMRKCLVRTKAHTQLPQTSSAALNVFTGMLGAQQSAAPTKH